MSEDQRLENEFQRILENPDNVIVSSGLQELLGEDNFSRIGLSEAIFKCSLGEFEINLQKIKLGSRGGSVQFFCHNNIAITFLRSLEEVKKDDCLISGLYLGNGITLSHELTSKWKYAFEKDGLVITIKWRE